MAAPRPPLKQRLWDDPQGLRARLLKEYQTLLQRRRLWEPVWQSIADLIRPMKNDIIVRKSPGTRRTDKMFDSTAIFSSELLAASLHGTLTSSYNKWFGLTTDNPDQMTNSKVLTWLSFCAEDMRLAFNRSNHSQESHEGYLDIVDFGTFLLLFEDRSDEGKKGEFRFTSVQIQNSAIGEDGMGRVNRVYHSFPLDRAAIIERFKDAEWGNSGFADDNMDPLTPFEVVHATVPSQDNGKGNLRRPEWLSVYFLQEHDIRLQVDSFHEFPWMVGRWTKTTGEVYGRGRGHTALPDVKTLNKMVEMELRALGKAIDPPLVQKGGDIIGQVHLQRGGLSTVRNMEGLGMLYKEWPGFQPMNLKTKELQEAIKRMFYADQLQMPTDNPQMTATESNIRYELMQRILGPTLGRLETEYLSPMVLRAFRIRQRAGAFPDPPDELFEDSSGKQKRNPMISVGYEGPMARAQKAGNVGAVQQLIQLAEPLLQVQPPVPVMDNLDIDGIFRDAAVNLGINSKYIRDEATVEADREERAQQEQQAQQAQQQNETMKSAAPMVKALHQAPQKGSVAHAVTGLSGGEEGGQGGGQAQGNQS